MPLLSSVSKSPSRKLAWLTRRRSHDGSRSNLAEDRRAFLQSALSEASHHPFTPLAAAGRQITFEQAGAADHPKIYARQRLSQLLFDMDYERKQQLIPLTPSPTTTNDKAKLSSHVVADAIVLSRLSGGPLLSREDHFTKTRHKSAGATSPHNHNQPTDQACHWNEEAEVLACSSAGSLTPVDREIFDRASILSAEDLRSRHHIVDIDNNNPSSSTSEERSANQLPAPDPHTHANSRSNVSSEDPQNGDADNDDPYPPSAHRSSGGGTDRIVPAPTLRRKALVVLSIANGSCQRLEFGTSELLKIVHLNRPVMGTHGPDEHLSGTLKLRDLRQICSSGVGAQRPSIEPRRSCILVNMPYVKALILRNRIFLLARVGAPDTDNRAPQWLHRTEGRIRAGTNHTSCSHMDVGAPTQDDFVSEVEGVASVSLVQKLVRVSEVQKAAPFEFLALESILFEVVSRLSDALDPMQILADRVQNQQTYVLSSTAKLHEIRDTKRLLQEVEAAAKGVAKSLEEILENEEDVRRLEISRFWERPEEWDEPADSPGAEDAEILLESYQQDIESLLLKIDGMDETLDTLLQIMQLQLATTRNNLLKFEIGLQVISVVVGMVAAVAGIFGMNIPNGYEKDHTFFWTMSRAMGWIITVVSASVFVFILRLKL